MTLSDKKKRKVRHYNAWRMESSFSYGHTLPSEARRWLFMFEGEYYCGEDHGIHPADLKTELYRAQNAANRDLMTASIHKVREQVQKIEQSISKSKHPEEVSRWYHPSDYKSDSGDNS
jgi:hypothetical protein